MLIQNSFLKLKGHSPALVVNFIFDLYHNTA